MARIFANSGDPDQTPHSAASDLSLHYLPITLLGVSRQNWIKPAIRRFPILMALDLNFVLRGFSECEKWWSLKLLDFII